MAFVFRKQVIRMMWSVPFMVLVPLLTGCETESYSKDLKYGLRTDPILLQVPTVEQLKLPDRPGQYPIMAVATLTTPETISDDDALYTMYKFYQTFDKDNKPQGLDQTKVLDLNDPKLLPPKLRRPIERALDDLFGTPAAPVVQGSEIDARLRSELQLDEVTLERGSRLYRINCLHCHGLTGDGRGQTSPWVNPHPRDYRRGNFKFVSSGQPQGKQKPLRSDLMRSIKNGLDGSAMPAFNTLSETDLDAIISYVIHLSLRGETEMQLLKEAIKANQEAKEAKRDLDFSPADLGATYLTLYGQNWLEAQKAELKPDDFPYDENNFEEMRASIQRGREFFIDQKNGCAKCHINFGRDSGFRFDGWGTLGRPRDLTQGMYRGGRRPIDIYWRVALGINSGGPGDMLAFRDPLKQTPQEKEKKINRLWDVVNFVRILPYPAMREKYGINVEFENGLQPGYNLASK
jgi:mono/diheme cytochrome c family protein